jgi:hypothetical protein
VPSLTMACRGPDPRASIAGMRTLSASM